MSPPVLHQALALLALHLLGLAVALAIGPRRAPALCAALAFPVGLAAAVLLALLVMLLGLSYEPLVLGGAMALTTAVAATAAARRGLDRRALTVVAAWTAGFALACPLIAHANVALISTIDSHRLLTLAIVMVNDGGMTDSTIAQLDRWGVFQVVAHSLAGLAATDFLYSLPVALGLSFLPAFALCLWHGLDAVDAPPDRRGPLVALVTAALATMSMVAYHVIYVHTNMGSAIYLFGFVVLFWIAEVKRDPSWLPLAFLSLAALALHRTEAPLVALLFLAFTVGQTELPRRPITICLALYALVVALWQEALARHVSEASQFLTPGRSRMLWLASGAVLAWWLASARPAVRALNRRLPVVIGAGAALAVAAAFALKPAHMGESLASWAVNLTSLSLWGQTWLVLAVLTLLALAAPAPPFRQAFAIGLPVYAAFVLLLAFLRVPYRLGLGDSANRMTIHFVPLLLLYLALKLLPGVSARPTERHSA